FAKDTQIELMDGQCVPINKIQIDDVLRFGERVVGVVEINATDLDTKEYYLNNGMIICGGPNIQICDLDLGIMSTLDLSGKKINNKKLYHLLTDKSTFYINGIRVYDYNAGIEKYLASDNLKLLTVLL
ncbi:unnamed protein product, partial [marine sediment metagenome]